jgi:hypothetical protein
MLIRVSYAPVVLFFVFVFSGIGRRIAALPESFNKGVALGVI